MCETARPVKRALRHSTQAHTTAPMRAIDIIIGILIGALIAASIYFLIQEASAQPYMSPELGRPYYMPPPYRPYPGQLFPYGGRGLPEGPGRHFDPRPYGPPDPYHGMPRYNYTRPWSDNPWRDGPP